MTKIIKFVFGGVDEAVFDRWSIVHFMAGGAATGFTVSVLRLRGWIAVAVSALLWALAWELVEMWMERRRGQRGESWVNRWVGDPIAVTLGGIASYAALVVGAVALVVVTSASAGCQVEPPPIAQSESEILLGEVCDLATFTVCETMVACGLADDVKQCRYACCSSERATRRSRDESPMLAPPSCDTRVRSSWPVVYECTEKYAATSCEVLTAGPPDDRCNLGIWGVP
jgi:hypothetical protein